MIIRLTNDNGGRLLHSILYDRMYKACVELNPEMPANAVVNAWLTQLYNSDPSMHVLVNLENGTVTEHAVITINEAFGVRVVYCHHIVKDKPTKDNVAYYMEYLDKLKEQVNASLIAFSVAKNAKVYEKQYGYKSIRTVMIKSDIVENIDNG